MSYLLGLATGLTLGGPSGSSGGYYESSKTPTPRLGSGAICPRIKECDPLNDTEREFDFSGNRRFDKKNCLKEEYFFNYCIACRNSQCDYLECVIYQEKLGNITLMKPGDRLALLQSQFLQKGDAEK